MEFGKKEVQMDEMAEKRERRVRPSVFVLAVRCQREASWRARGGSEGWLVRYECSG